MKFFDPTLPIKPELIPGIFPKGEMVGWVVVPMHFSMKHECENRVYYCVKTTQNELDRFAGEDFEDDESDRKAAQKRLAVVSSQDNIVRIEEKSVPFFEGLSHLTLWQLAQLYRCPAANLSEIKAHIRRLLLTLDKK